MGQRKQSVDGLVSTEILAKAFGVKPLTITRWWQSGKMPIPIKVGRRILRFRIDDINAWIREGCPPIEGTEAIETTAVPSNL